MSRRRLGDRFLVRMPTGACRMWLILLMLPNVPVLSQEPPPETPPEILGAPSALDQAAFDEPRIVVPAGTAVRPRPDPGAPILVVIQSETELPELERRGGWVRVRHFGLKGWVVDPGRSADGASEPRVGPDRPTGPDPGVLARARGLLTEGGGEYPLGPWTLYTDVDDRRLLDSLDSLAGAVVETYRSRYGVDPDIEGDLATGLDGRPESGPAPEVVVLFARAQDHRAFLGEGSVLASLDAEGYAGAGLVVLHREGRSGDAVRSLLVHELVHLLDRRALGSRTPPWLEEGLAHSLASSRIEPAGRLAPEKLGGGVRVVDRRLVGPDGGVEITVETTGGLAGLDRVVGALDRGALEPLVRLTSMSWREMVDPEAREIRYAQSALFVRFLLDGAGERWRRGFRSYLAAIAAGDPGEPARLLEGLGTDWSALEEAFREWLRLRHRLTRVGGRVDDRPARPETDLRRN